MTPERIETVLADFRAWLQQAAAASAVPEPPVHEHAKPIDLHTLIGQFLALRHEVHLQTRAARAQQEQNAQALEQLGQALETVRQRDEAVESEGMRPVLKGLLDAEDALGLARREVQRARDVVLPTLDQLTATLAKPSEPPPAPPEPATSPPRSLWARLFQTAAPSAPIAVPTPQPERQSQALPELQRLRDWVDSLVTGYTMSLQRLERTLRQCGLEPIPCVGLPFDPETMEAVDAAVGTGQSAGQVLEEIRRGYLWRGRVFRYAQVRVAKS